MSGAYVLLDQLVDAGSAVWRASWQASVLAVLVLAVQLMLGNRLPARWRHAMWMLVLLRLALPVVPSSPMSVFNLAPRDVPKPAPVVMQIESAPILRGESVAVVLPLAASRIDTPSSAKPQAAAPAWTMHDVVTHWREIIASVWALGALVLALRIAWATFRVSRMLRTLEHVDEPAIIDVLRATAAELGVRRTPLLLAGEDFFSPALVGAVRPKLLVPADVLERFDPAELRLVFLHELAHLKRRDVAINWFATALTTLHWLNPFAWLVTWRLRIERELACDELVMSRTTDADRRAYGHTIVKLLEALAHGGSNSTSIATPLPPGGVGILEGKEQMKRRIVMIAQFARSSRTWTFVAVAIVLTLGLVALTDAVKAEDTPKPATQPTAAPEGGPGLEAERADLDRKFRVAQDQLAKLEREKATKAEAGASAKIKAGDLVLVSVMNLVGNGIETSKTTRVDDDGNIGLPYIGEIKAQGLKSNELEQAIAKAYKDKGVMEGAMVAVSLPARGESHQLAARRERAQNEPFAADPGLVSVPGAVPAAAVAAPGAPAPGMEGAARDVAIDPAVKAALDKKLPEVKFEQVPLGDVIDFLRDTTSVNIFVNWRALKEAGVEQTSTVTLKVRDVALKDVLALVLKEQDDNLQYRVENGVITIDDAIVREPRPKLATKAYDVRDLLTAGGSGAEGVGTFSAVESANAMNNLTKTICETVAPDSWRSNGGVGNISAYGTKLVVTASDEIHGEVANLLEMLRDKPATQPASTRVEKLLDEIRNERKPN